MGTRTRIEFFCDHCGCMTAGKRGTDVAIEDRTWVIDIDLCNDCLAALKAHILKFTNERAEPQ